MDPLQRIESLYNEALSLEPRERATFLDRVCGDDTELRTELQSLLACEKEAQTYLDKPAFEDIALSLSKEGEDVLVDRMVGRYQLLTLVGRGGMAEVYCAVDTRLNRLVAVKILPHYLAQDKEVLDRFEREARLVAALNHRHICTLHDVGREAGVHYLVFEYVVGEPLSERLRKGPLPLTETLQHGIEIADALISAHDIGIIHLDLKPENIMLTRTGVKLLDFGIAELRYPDSPSAGSSTDSAAAMNRTRPGTLGYMAPEQAKGHEVDGRADIFAFGAVLYQMLTGRSACPDKNLDSMPQPTFSDQAGLPASLESLVCRCLAYAPSDRWASIFDVHAELQKIGAELKP
jgi:serine/threonine protein kinase